MLTVYNQNPINLCITFSFVFGEEDQNTKIRNLGWRSQNYKSYNSSNYSSINVKSR